MNPARRAINKYYVKRYTGTHAKTISGHIILYGLITNTIDRNVILLRNYFNQYIINMAFDWRRIGGAWICI